MIGQPALPDLDPFLLLDEFGSDDPAAYIGGFPSHPHRGFETVTYMIAGRMRHRDNTGAEGLLGPGSVQWMTAGRGIVHSEMPEQDHGLMQGFQLWVNLPAKDKLVAPRIPGHRRRPGARVDLGHGAKAKIMAGEIAGVRGPVDPGETQPIFLDITLGAGARRAFRRPPATTPSSMCSRARPRWVRPGPGAGPHRRAFAGGRDAVRAGARLILAAGKPLREPVAKHSPFVMNTQAELRQAFEDFHAGGSRTGTRST